MNLLRKLKKSSLDPAITPFLLEFFPWVKVIYETQEEIAQLSDRGFYEKIQTGIDISGNRVSFPTYRSSEIYFWNPLLRWIYEDSTKRRISKTLDIGCGYGTLSLFTKKLSGCESYLVDFIDAYMSQNLIRKYSFNFRIMNIELESVPFGDIKFDTILFTEVLEHLNFNPIPTMKKLCNSLKEDGVFYLTTPDAVEWGKLTTFYEDYKQMPMPDPSKSVLDGHIYQYIKEEVLDILNQCGLTVERFDYAPGYKNSARHLCFMCRKESSK